MTVYLANGLSFQNLAQIPCEATTTINNDYKMLFNQNAKFGLELPSGSVKFPQQLNWTVYQLNHWTLEERAMGNNGVWNRTEINTTPQDTADLTVDALIAQFTDPRLKPNIDKALLRHHATLIIRTKRTGSGRPAKVDW